METTIGARAGAGTSLCPQMAKSLKTFQLAANNLASRDVG